MKSTQKDCKVIDTLNTLAGKWKLVILLHLEMNGTLRFNELKSKIPDITQKMLTSQLRELEKEHLIQRVIYPQIPPKVEYSISEHGKTLQPILDQMHLWGEAHLAYMEGKSAEVGLTKN